MYLCKFGQNPSTGSKDIVSERSYADADADDSGIRTKNNMSPTFGWGDITRIVRGSDYSPASELFARERQTMTGNNAKLDLVNVDAHKKIGQILTICS